MTDSIRPWASVVIPIKDERDNLTPLTERVLNVLSAREESKTAPFELLYIDDGSSDGSSELLDRLQQTYPAVRVLHFDRNYGQSSAFDAGFKHSTGEIVITLDGDLQNDPAEEQLDQRVQPISTGSLKSFFELVSRASLFVGNNSGPMHIASACGTPAMILTGPSSYHWRPMWHLDQFTLLRDPSLACQPCDKLIGPMNRCMNKTEPMACMKRVTVDEAYRVAVERLGIASDSGATVKR